MGVVSLVGSKGGILENRVISTLGNKQWPGFLLLFFILLLFWGCIQQCSGVTPGSVFRNYSWCAQGTYGILGLVGSVQNPTDLTALAPAPGCLSHRLPGAKVKPQACSPGQARKKQTCPRHRLISQGSLRGEPLTTNPIQTSPGTTTTTTTPNSNTVPWRL